MTSAPRLTEKQGETRHGEESGPESLDAAASRAYHELRAIAHGRLRGRIAGRGADRGTFSTTALVHEAYLRLAEASPTEWRDRSHFLAVASLAMRHVLVDRARERAAQKRGGALRRVTLDDEQIGADDQAEALLELDEAVDRLAAWNPRLARVVECRFFGGLSEGETAQALGITIRTVQRDWVKARVLLRQALGA